MCMNLTEFLKTVDSIMRDKTREELAVFVHEQARQLPKDEREIFLQKLNSQREDDSRKGDETSDLREAVKQAEAKLELIETGELYLREEYNEEYDDWYNSSAEEILYIDDDGLCGILDRCMQMVEDCIDHALYSMAYELAENLVCLEIQTDGEYTGEPLDLEELCRLEMLAVPFEAFAGHAVLAAYMGNEGDGRVDAVYRMMVNLRGANISLEDIFQESEQELPEFKTFLQEWIILLGAKTGRLEQRLLEEAIVLVDDRKEAICIARKYSDTHPGLFLLLLRSPNEADIKKIEWGEEGLAKIAVNKVIRSRIALETAAAAMRCHLPDTAEHCWQEAFRSDTTPINYLRLRTESRDYTTYQGQVSSWIADFIENERGNESAARNSYEYAEELRENKPNENQLLILQFLEGNFEQVYQNGMQIKGNVGWSMTFMKEGMSLFLLLLYQGEALPVGCREQCLRAAQDCGIEERVYVMGLNVQPTMGNIERFWRCFCSWKGHMKLDEEFTDTWLKRLDVWIRRRVQGIMDGNYRNYYGECAAYIASLGEVLESRGNLGAKAKLMEKYRSEYSRRRAFHEELRKYGMKDTRKEKS